MATWRDDKILELASQLTYSPADKRHEQLRAAIALMPHIDATKTYPWDLVHFRVTGFQPVSHSDHNIPGNILRTDLSTLIEFLSDTLAIKIEDAISPGIDDAVLALDEVTKKFSVSSKTIQRWRKQGLIAQRFVYPDGRRRLGFFASSITQFATDNKQRVERSATFRHLSDDEKLAILTLARRLAVHRGCCIKDISRRVAHKLNCSPETVRTLIRKHDGEFPEAAIFPKPEDLARRLDGQAIIQSFDHGTPIDDIAQRFHRTTSSILQVVTRERLLRLKNLKIEYISNPLFEHPDADNIILSVLPADAVSHAQATVAAGTNAKAADVYMARTPRDLPPYLAEIFHQPVMPQELEIDGFRRLNYLKYKAAILRNALAADTATLEAVTAIESLLAQAAQVKNQLVHANLRVAVHVARKHQRIDRPLPELFSDATIWLMRSVDCFDFARNTRFSTYAGYAIMKNFARDRSEQLTRRDFTMVTGQDDLLDLLGDRDTATAGDRIDDAAMHSHLCSVIEELPQRERELVTRHYGLDESQEPMSLSELGAKMGITKARVRQLETRALRRLRKLLDARRTTLQTAQAH